GEEFVPTHRVAGSKHELVEESARCENVDVDRSKAFDELSVRGDSQASGRPVTPAVDAAGRDPTSAREKVPDSVRAASHHVRDERAPEDLGGADDERGAVGRRPSALARLGAPGSEGADR